MQQTEKEALNLQPQRSNVQQLETNRLLTKA